VTNYEQFFDLVLVGLYEAEKRRPDQKTTLGSVASAKAVPLRTYAAVQFAEDCRENLFAEVEATKYRPSTWKTRILKAGIRHVEDVLLRQTAVDSSSWTGRPNPVVLDEERRERIAHELTRIQGELENLTLTNSERSQVVALVLAAKVLAESPNPPGDLIWEIVERASSIASVASLFIAIIALLRSHG